MSQSQLVDRILVNKPEADRVILNKAYITTLENQIKRHSCLSSP